MYAIQSHWCHMTFTASLISVPTQLKLTIPSSIWKESLVVTDESSDHRADVILHYLSTHKAPDGSFFFSRLSQVAKLVLLIPHSNAKEEQIFSMVRKNKTAFCPSLDLKGTLKNVDHTTSKYRPSKEVLRKAKSATWEYNKTHSKKWLEMLMLLVCAFEFCSWYHWKICTPHSQVSSSHSPSYDNSLPLLYPLGSYVCMKYNLV